MIREEAILDTIYDCLRTEVGVNCAISHTEVDGTAPASYRSTAKRPFIQHLKNGTGQAGMNCHGVVSLLSSCGALDNTQLNVSTSRQF
jgi:hypothetical protein